MSKELKREQVYVRMSFRNIRTTIPRIDEVTE